MFMWMFIEGLYLHNMVTVAVFQGSFPLKFSMTERLVLVCAHSDDHRVGEMHGHVYGHLAGRMLVEL